MTKEQHARLQRLREHLHAVRSTPTVPEAVMVRAGVYYRALDDISFLIDLIDERERFINEFTEAAIDAHVGLHHEKPYHECDYDVCAKRRETIDNAAALRSGEGS